MNGDTSALSLADHPIESSREDLLSRSRLAEILARELLAIPAAHGSVAAITGDWGSGKTSILNMVSEQLQGRDDVSVVSFNPWLFAGVEQLTVTFLTELSRQLSDEETLSQKFRDSVAGVARKVSEYAASFSVLRLVPLGGTVLDVAGGVAEAAKKFTQDDPGIESQRDSIIEALRTLQGRIVVFVDDIDRLTPDETKDLFRVIRLTASFPNMVYLLCLDMNVVGSNLSANGVDGQDYLAKILTILCQVPDLPRHAKRQIFLRALDEVLARHPHGPINQSRWSDVYVTLIEPQMRTLRDAKRLLASLPFALESIGDEIDLVDVLALEGFRVLRPEILSSIKRHAAALTAVQSDSSSSSNAQAEAVRELLDLAGAELGRELVTQVFPAAAAHVGGGNFGATWLSIWQRDRLVAHEKILGFYFEREYEPAVAPGAAVDEAAQAMRQGDAMGFSTALGSLGELSLEDALDRLLSAVEDVPPESVPEIVPVLFDLFPALRGEGSRGLFDFGSEFAVTRLALRLLRKLEASAVFAIASRVIEESSTVFGAFEMESLVGYRENAGHQLVSESDDVDLRLKLRDRVIRSTPAALTSERHLVRILYHVLRPVEGGSDEPVMPQLANPELAAAVLSDAVSAVHSQTLGSSFVSTTYRLNWAILVTLFGSEQALAAAVKQIRSTHPDPDEELSRALDLYDRYAAGWRPKE